MNIKKLILSIVSFAMAAGSTVAQNAVSGRVFESNNGTKSPLVGASVYWSGTQIGTTSGADGSYTINIPSNPDFLVFSFVGFMSDSIKFNGQTTLDIILKSSVQLQGVQIQGKRDAVEISTIKTINIEQIGQKELLKAACCNLSESFETSPSVNVAYADAVTGAKEIQLLGLSGIYAQIMTENIPNMRGLASPYGLSYIPGPWMESIQVTKGSGSVANGFESTTGQINVEYLKPENAPKFYLNLYGAESSNHEINVITSAKTGEHTTGSVMLHADNMPLQWDHNHDGFLDMPLTRNLNALARLSYNDGKKFEGQFMIKGLNELRRGGQLDQVWVSTPDIANGYGTRINTNRIEVSSKTGMIFPETPWRSVGLILSGHYHQQDSYFGLKTHDAWQTGFYGSLIYMSIFGTTDHKWKAGLDMRSDFMEEYFLDYPYYKEEYVPGAYFEYTLNVKEKFGVVAGIRGDHHNQWGFFATPRLHMKYNFTENLIVRASAGKSFRTPNLFTDNFSMLATSKRITLYEELQPERAWNYGANLTWKFRLFWRPGSFSFDYYITDFINQMVVDPYTYSEITAIYNLPGSSFAKSLQATFNYELFKRFDLRLAYKQDQVETDYISGRAKKPLIPDYRALINLAYESRKEDWRYDFTLQMQGKSNLGVTKEEAPLYQQGHDGHAPQIGSDNLSPAYITINGQVTKVFNKKWDAYVGVENLLDFRQDLPIIGFENPFGTYFDATNVWGPVMGRKIYLGLRYSINQKKQS
ncbi:MAG: TonB-dependent receptor [Bacteroidota bacterium]